MLKSQIEYEIKLPPDSTYVETAIIATITPLGFRNWYRNVSTKFTGFKLSLSLDDF